MSKVINLKQDQITNGAEETLSYEMPYIVTVGIEGVCPLIFHRWNCEAVEAKSKAAKGSKAKKSDDIESYLYRNGSNQVCLPGEYIRQSIIHAAKFKQDPRSPRKSAMDLFKAALVCLTELTPVGDNPDFIDQRRVTVQRNGITRLRPAMKTGWKAEIDIMVNIPEYVSPTLLHQVLGDAGRLVGVGNFRPTYGRFAINKWNIHEQ